MAKGLVGKLGRIVGCGLVAASSFLYSGCEEPPTAGQGFGALGEIMQAGALGDSTLNPAQRRGVGVIGRGISAASQGVMANEAARRGRSNIEQNVYVQPNVGGEQRGSNDGGRTKYFFIIRDLEDGKERIVEGKITEEYIMWAEKNFKKGYTIIIPYQPNE